MIPKPPMITMTETEPIYIDDDHPFSGLIEED
jgi:hypothetical protein